MKCLIFIDINLYNFKNLWIEIGKLLLNDYLKIRN